MKNTVIKSVLALVMAFMALPMMGQDFMSIYFKNGNVRKYFMPYVQEISVSKYDKNDNMHNDYQFQHVITSSNKYIYNLADIDSITYTKCDEAEVEQNIVSSLNTIIPILDECTNISDVEKNLDLIKKADGLETAWIGGGQLNVKVKGWGIIGFHFHAEEQVDNESNVAEEWELKLMNKIASISKKANESNGAHEKLKVAIANQMKNNKKGSDVNLTEQLEKIREMFESCGIYPEKVDPSLDFFSSGMFDYDVIVLATHGSIGVENGAYWKDEEGSLVHFLYVSDFLGAIDHEATDDDKRTAISNLKPLLEKKGWMDFLSNDLIRVDFIKEYKDFFHGYWVAYPLIRENFIRDASSDKVFKNPNSLLFAAVCHSLEGSTSLAWKLHETKKLGNYLGYNGEIGMESAPLAAFYYFESLLKGFSLRKSVENIPDDYKSYTKWRLNTELRSIMGEDSFLFPTITKPIDQTEAQVCFENNGYVEVEGYATYLPNSDPNDNSMDIKMGFMYGTDEKLSSCEEINNVQVIKLPKPLDNGDGNVVFRGKLTNLEPNKTYYYRAYTYDDLCHNYYGEPESFTIYEKLTLSTNAITVSALTSSTVQITSGSGSYSIIENTAPDVVTAKIIDNKSIVFEAHKAGPATITVKDDKSGQTATIEVMVTEGTDPVPYLTCPDDHHPHLIDLGLPSGTLWSCCNVGATSPEGYGGYYAWYETEEKDNYSWKTYIHCDGTGDTFHINELYEDGFSNRYDVAHVLWGGDWRMPTKKQTEELRSNCTYEWTEINGVMGGKFTSKSNGGSIFLPAAGWRKNINIYNVMNEGFYWTSSASIDEEDSWLWGYSFEVESWGSSISDDNPYQGLSVRPVTTPEVLALSLNTLVMKIGQSTTVEITSGSGRYSIESISPQDVVTVEIKGNIVNIDALKAGSANITIKDTKSGQTSSINVAVIGGEAPVSYLTCPDDNHPHLIDLGLPSGTKWACCNVGATTPENYGDYYAWGETETKTKYNESKYKYYKDGNYVSLGSDIAGTQYDVALVKWGGLWVMPSYDQQTELRENCSFKWTSVNGIKGRVFTGPNGGSIFLPASGYRLQGDLYGGNSSGYYWSSSQDQSRSNYAYLLYLESRGINSRQSNRYYGQNVRPVVR